MAENDMTNYIAFLRGINVGGHKKVPMAELKQMFEKMGFKNVKTFLASGNVVFGTEKENVKTLAEKIASNVEKAFGFLVHIIVRTVSDIEKMLQSEPFRDVKVTSQTRLYVTFLSEKPKSKLEIPYSSPDQSFRILNVTNGVIFSVVDLTKTGTLDAMDFLEKEFGKNITTRNWNTVIKIVKR